MCKPLEESGGVVGGYMRACVHMPVRVRVLVRVRMLANFDFQPLPLTTVNVYVRSRAHHTHKRRIPCVPPATRTYTCIRVLPDSTPVPCDLLLATYGPKHILQIRFETF